MRRVLLLAGVISLGLAFSLDANAESGRKKPTAPLAEHGKSEPKLVTVTYGVADLVVPIAYTLEARKAKEATQEDALMRLICATLAPNSWEKSDDQTAIQYYPLGMSLVVRQTREVQEDIAALLASLRRLQDVQVSLDVCMMSVPDALAQKILVSLEPTGRSKVTLVKNEDQVRKMMETAFKDTRTQVLQAPKMTVFNGQRGSISVCDNRFFLTGVTINSANGQTFFSPNNAPMEIGFRSTVCPTVSADRQAVLLDLQVKRTTVTEPVPLVPVQIPVPQVTEAGQKVKNGDAATIFQMFFQQPKVATQIVDQKFSVPVGNTALIVAGNEQRQTRVEDTSLTATLLEWAGIRDHVSYTTEACTTILLVTPRIIVSEEHPEMFSGKKSGSSLRPLGN